MRILLLLYKQQWDICRNLVLSNCTFFPNYTWRCNIIYHVSFVPRLLGSSLVLIRGYVSLHNILDASGMIFPWVIKLHAQWRGSSSYSTISSFKIMFDYEIRNLVSKVNKSCFDNLKVIWALFLYESSCLDSLPYSKLIF